MGQDMMIDSTQSRNQFAREKSIKKQYTNKQYKKKVPSMRFTIISIIVCNLIYYMLRIYNQRKQYCINCSVNILLVLRNKHCN